MLRSAQRLTPQFLKLRAAVVRAVQRAQFHHAPSTKLVSFHQLTRSNAQQVRFFSKKYPEHQVLSMPALSPTMTKGNLAAWKKQVGDEVKPGEVMAEVETDKATVAFESTESGYIAKILVPAGTQDVDIGSPVAILVEEKADVAAFADYSVDGAASAPAPAPASTPAAPATPAPTSSTSTSTSTSSTTSAAPAGGRVSASPLAKKLANEAGINLSSVKPTGPNNRVVAADVKEFAASRPAVTAAAPVAKTVAAAPAAAAAPVTPAPASIPAPPATGSYVDIPHTQIRKVIAQRLTESKQKVPHYYLTIECNMDKVLKLRNELNSRLEKDGVKLSVNDIIVKATSLACRKVPAANSSWLDNVIRQYNYVDVCVAVSTETGLITPIIADADIKGLSQISKETKDLAGKARQGKLLPHEYQGGTITISNLGMYGVKNFSAIINPPQACILAVGTTEQKVTATTSKDGQPQFGVSQVMSVTLSCDHRVVDGAVGAQFLQAFKSYIEEPTTMLL